MPKKQIPSKYINSFDEKYIELPSIVHSAYESNTVAQDTPTEHTWNVTRSYAWINQPILEVWSFSEPYKFSCVDKIILSEPENSPLYYYVNWGWGENQGNGWYYNISNIAPPGRTNVGMRCMLTGIRPNV